MGEQALDQYLAAVAAGGYTTQSARAAYVSYMPSAARLFASLNGALYDHIEGIGQLAAGAYNLLARDPETIAAIGNLLEKI